MDSSAAGNGRLISQSIYWKESSYIALICCFFSLVSLQGNNALHYAVSFRNWKLVEVLLETGLVNLNLPNKVQDVFGGGVGRDRSK